ncbi:MAG: PIG-L family deacetylase, partial [Caldilinea sp.]|nr:PIG-L family deacetylase [Caldilinea sp.]
MKGLEAFEDVKRAIVVAAHPDDLECCCSGTLLQLIARGVEVFSVNCTLGDIGDSEGRLRRPALA